jgi:uncharacterized protein
LNKQPGETITNHAGATETSRDIVKRFYDFLCAGDFEGILSCFHLDIEIHEPECLPYGGVYKGMEGAMKLFSEAPKLLDVGVFKVDALIADGNLVAGMLQTAIVGTGEPLAVAEVSTVKDGKIIKVRVFQWDPTIAINCTAWAHDPRG